MGYSFPFALATLSSTGSRPIDKKPIYAIHFNRVFYEITAIESAIGLNPQGNKTDLKTRLAVYLNNDGTYKRGFVCEDDPSGNQRGTTRFFDSQCESVTINPTSTVGGKPLIFVPLAYSAWDEPPVMVCCWQRTIAQGFSDNLTRNQILAISEVGMSYDTRKFDSTNINTADAEKLAWIAVSRSLHVWEEDVAWCLPPARTGS
jgi:hypothetical protein